MVALICCTEVLVVERVVAIRVLRRIPHLTTLRLGTATWQSLVAFLKGRKAAKAWLHSLWAQSLMLASCAMVARFHHKVILAGTLTSVIVRVNEVTNIRVVTPLADVFIAFPLDDLTNLCIAKALTPELLNPLGKLVCIPIQIYMNRAMSKCGLTYVFLKGLGMRLPAGFSVLTSA